MVAIWRWSFLIAHVLLCILYFLQFLSKHFSVVQGQRGGPAKDKSPPGHKYLRDGRLFSEDPETSRRVAQVRKRSESQGSCRSGRPAGETQSQGHRVPRTGMAFFFCPRAILNSFL